MSLGTGRSQISVKLQPLISLELRLLKALVGALYVSMKWLVRF